MRGKKGELPWYTISLITILSGAMLGVVIMYTLFAGEGSLTSYGIDNLCKFGANIRSASSPGGKVHAIPELCPTRYGEINSDDLDKCPNTKDGLDKLEEKRDLYQNEDDILYSICTIEQMLELSRRCWELRGSGGKNPGDFECFEATIKSPKGIFIHAGTGADFYVFSGLFEYNEKSYARILSRKDEPIVLTPNVGSTEYQTIWRKLSIESIFKGADKWYTDECIQNEETWSIFSFDADKWDFLGDYGDMIWIGCVANCEDRKCDDRRIVVDEDTVVQVDEIWKWWMWNIEEKEIPEGCNTIMPYTFQMTSAVAER